MDNFTHLIIEKDSNDIIWLGLAVQNKSANILTRDVLHEIQAACQYCVSHHAKGLVIHSLKSNGFIAGADIEQFKKKSKATHEPELAMEYIQLGQQTCHTIEQLKMPTVALIDGFCMGGGTELSLACDYMICSDHQSTKISLPEVKLGIHPGFGGTVRSIRKMGVLNAMPMMLTGRHYKARQALKTGLVDYSVARRQLKNTALFVIENTPKQRLLSIKEKILNHSIIRPLIASKMRKQLAEHANQSHYPAPYALIELWEKYADDEAKMYEKEAQSVAQLILSTTAQNLVRVFFLQNQLKDQGDKKALKVQRVHIVGGGIMGGDIATWCATQGLIVTVQDMTEQAIAKVIQRSHKSLQRYFKKDRIAIRDSLDRIIPDIAGDGIAKADVIIEAIFENLEAKQKIFKNLEAKAKPDAILATNTSSMTLTDIASVLQQPERLIGLHFFNPVFKMPLLEIVYDPALNNQQYAKLGASFARQINKLPLMVKSSSGFLINRILMPYLLEGIKLYQQGVPVLVVDKAAKDFGMPMGPLELADTVGLDICFHVGKILSKTLDISLPKQLEELIAQGNLGKKTGAGFYQYPKGKKGQPNFPEPQWEGKVDMIQYCLIEKILLESEQCLTEGVVENSDLLDAGVIFGTGFAPFRGGPLFYSSSLKE
ncbi:MAG: enoyl-CoA hydratase/isomerase family protein [Thiotrichaceae bacterium]|nr:enoyl-CoA hydratase/isomerase family protein [Thiotrichaceae bacterium]